MTAALLVALLNLQTTSQEFVYEADKDLKSVAVAGSFNNWNKDAEPMKSVGRRWSATIKLKPGSYQYKFVLNGENWITDPKGKDVSDGNGHTNSLLVIVPEDYARFPGKKDDGLFTSSAIAHQTSVPWLNFDQGKLMVTLQVRKDDIGQISVRAGQQVVKMKRIGGDELVDLYRGEMKWDRKRPLKYVFALQDGPNLRTFGPDGLSEVSSIHEFSLDPMSYKPFTVPAWVEGTVFYQIFPDRFDNGNAKNDPLERTPWTGIPTYWNRYGGDIAGLSRRADYLKRLGVSAIYINPIMTAPSNHRYDPADFYKVDPEIGTNAEFVALTKHLDKKGIKVVLDQIFDHVGTTFPPFVDVLMHQKNSKYKDWFFIKSWPVEVRPNPPYVGWWGSEYMPKIDLSNQDAYDYLMKSVDYWMKEATLAGWRLDVANEAPDWFWRDFRKRVKGHDPNAWIVGEVWTDAGQWLKGDQWDASMNYPFRDVCLGFFAKRRTTPTEFVNGLMRVHNLYVPQVSRNQLNLISSHDVPRFLTEAGGNRKLAAMAAVTQFTWPGAPSVYYGEELGMEGGADPMNRKGMRWDFTSSSHDLLSLYTKLAHIRTRAKVLAAGEPVILNQDDAAQVASYGRRFASDFAVVAFNRSDSEAKAVIQLPREWGREVVNALTGERVHADSRGRLTLTLSPVSAFFGLNASTHHLTLVADANAAAQKQVSIKEPLP